MRILRTCHSEEAHILMLAMLLRLNRTTAARWSGSSTQGISVTMGPAPGQQAGCAMLRAACWSSSLSFSTAAVANDSPGTFWQAPGGPLRSCSWRGKVGGSCSNSGAGEGLLYLLWEVGRSDYVPSAGAVLQLCGCCRL
jgi:hypothetical protein